MTIRFTLLADGSFDRVLMPIINWLLSELRVAPVQGEWANLTALPKPPKNLTERVQYSLNLYPCDILFVHRDAEGQPHSVRKQEIERAVLNATAGNGEQVHAAIIPVRMTEAWLLFDEQSIRNAASNPRGTTPLGIPAPHQWESLPDPKANLHAALRSAKELNARRAKRFDAGAASVRVSQLITDFSPLRSLSAFRDFESETVSALRKLGAVP